MEAWAQKKPKWRSRKFRAQKPDTNNIKANTWYIIFYGMGCLVYFIGCLYQSCSFLMIYFQYPTTIEVNVLQEPVIEFPAVTVCNGNRVRKSILCKHYNEACKPVPEDPYQAQEFIKNLGKAYQTINRTMRILMGSQREEFIQSCTFEDQSCKNSIGHYFNFEYTNCYTINGRWADESQETLASSMFRPKSGRSSELLLLLNVQKEEYTPMTPVVKARMTIHSPNTLPNPQYDGVSLQTGRTYSYGVRTNIVNVLPSPYQTNCKNYTGLKERRTNATLTQEDCMSLCCADYHYRFCNCTVHRLSLIYDVRTCIDAQEVGCLKANEQRVTDFCYPKCRMPCSKVTYDYVSVDSFVLQQGACSDDELQNRSLTKKNRENLICLRVFFSSAESEIYSHKPKYNGIQVFSIIGGYIGLWLGISFLNVHNYVMTRLDNYLKHRRGQKVTQPDY